MKYFKYDAGSLYYSYWEVDPSIKKCRCLKSSSPDTFAQWGWWRTYDTGAFQGGLYIEMSREEVFLEML